MRIGILTFYRVANFGANLQALSTYRYLKKHNHQPIMINYYDRSWYEKFCNTIKKNVQASEHINFVEEQMLKHTDLCFNAKDINEQISKLDIEAIIIGSDAVVQHHPIFTRLARGKRKPIYIEPISSDRLFPNPLWGVGIKSSVPLALMSASSQNSQYVFFTSFTKKRMRKALTRFTYLGVRDTWTYKMFNKCIGLEGVNLTPDPVFAFNNNALELVPSEKDIREKYDLPLKYVLISLRGQCIPFKELQELQSEFNKNSEIKCVALPMPEGITFKHPFEYEIPTPLNPLEWYALIKYSSGYIGCNMHPIVVSLHNVVPCFSIDNWGNRNWRGNAKNDGSSKVEDILNIFELRNNRIAIGISGCHINVSQIVSAILNFPYDTVRIKAKEMQTKYQRMMDEILLTFNK